MVEISNRAAEFKGSAIRRLARMLEQASQNKNMISFGGGAPSLAPPQEIVDALVTELKERPQLTLSYSSTMGFPELRELISEDLKASENVDISAEEMTLTVGGTEGLFITIQAVLNPGDEIILANPSYLGYPTVVKLLGGKRVPVHVKWQENFQLLPDRVNEAITKNTKAILMLSPDNPTGRVMDKENIKGLVDIVQDKDLWLVTDDVYKDITYDAPFYNSRTFGGYENTITCCSFSKSASMPGARLGYAYGPKDIIQKMGQTKQAISLVSHRFAQIPVMKFLENGAKIKNEYVSKIVVPTYKKRRDAMAEYLKKYLPHIKFAKPEGAFFFFIEFKEDLERMKLTETEFSDRLFKEKEVVVIPGPPFGEFGKDHFRLTFVSENEQRIEEGIKKIAEFIGV